jgi:hypothetical protein
MLYKNFVNFLEMFRGLQRNCGLKLTVLTCDTFGTDLWKQNKEAARQLKDTHGDLPIYEVSDYDRRQYLSSSLTPLVPRLMFYSYIHITSY